MGNEQIYVSYRRKGGDFVSGWIVERLIALGYSVYYDALAAEPALSPEELFQIIDGCDDFILILSEGALDRCAEPGDVLRAELEYALSHNKNIIPVSTVGFRFSDQLSVALKELNLLDCICAHGSYFDEAMEKIVARLTCRKKNGQAEIDLPAYREKLRKVRQQLESGQIDEIPLDARPKMPKFDPKKDSYVVVSYSRKDFEQVYLFLAYLHNEGYRFWYDAGMLGTDKWLTEFREKYEAPNCLGTLTFFSDHYISNSTKAELSVIFDQDHYCKQNMFISLIPIAEMDPSMLLGNAILDKRLDPLSMGDLPSVLKALIQAETDRTIHRYNTAEDIPFLVETLEKVFSIRESGDGAVVPEATRFAIGNGVLYKYMGDEAEVTIPGSVTTIAAGAFRKCSTLERVIIPEGVTVIGEEAFAECGALKTVSLPDSIRQIEKEAFSKCQSIERIEIPDGVTEIKEKTFFGCMNLREVCLSEAVVSIEREAFFECRSLEKITIPNSVTKIGQGAFAYCRSLISITIPDGIAVIEQATFKACSNLTAVSLPDSVTQIGATAFSFCEKLSFIDLPANLLQISRRAFEYCCLMRVILPHGLKKIESRAFYRCQFLRQVVIPDTVTHILEDAFLDCHERLDLQYQGSQEQWEQIKTVDDENLRLPGGRRTQPPADS